ncbi:MAG: DEAD/DEAH box helicase [Bacteroidetes bacterium]|nr:MAG: DEAD/DEAH box helicase [Bacteroidota bacterium]
MTEEIQSFSQLALNKQILTAVEQAGYTSPTPIQIQAIPTILAGHDVLGIAQTGTGKTAAFVLPLLMKLSFAQGTPPRVVILSPTRELAMQIFEQVKTFSKNCGLRSLCVYGGTPIEPQIRTIKKGIDILIATPGRLLDIYYRGEVNFREINTLVLDEADKMMDMGFMPQIRKMLEVLPKKRQNLLFSATMPDKVFKLASEFLEFPVRVEVAPQSTAVDSVEQTLYHVPNIKTKLNLLSGLLSDEEDFNRVMIFVRTKHGANNVGKFLQRKIKGEVRVIHGNKSQSMRINAMAEFKSGKVRIMVATDVSARGIDVKEISHVINFDVSLVAEDYVHRIGRTGRASHSGKAITFCTDSERHYLRNIETMLKMRIPVQQIPEGINVEETTFEEKQKMLKEMDDQKKRSSPKFKGAFHEKKNPSFSRKTSSFGDRPRTASTGGGEGFGASERPKNKSFFRKKKAF